MCVPLNLPLMLITFLSVTWKNTSENNLASVTQQEEDETETFS